MSLFSKKISAASPLNRYKAFINPPSPLWGSQLRLIPPFYSPKNQVIPPKILPPTPQVINNDRSLRLQTAMTDFPSLLYT